MWFTNSGPQIVAQKEILLNIEGSRREREKHKKAMKDELDFLTTLKHPHIIEYVHHEHEQDNVLRIFTEYCELGDLQEQFNERSL
jgi:serine/threonine protein kinase